MDPETYAAAINRAAEALHDETQRSHDNPTLPLEDYSVDYRETVYRTATLIVDALVDLLPKANEISVALSEPSHVVSEELAYFEPDPGLPAVRVSYGTVSYGSQSYWNITQGDSPLALAAALLAAEQYAKAAA
ncbi:hypothetical protein [Rhodococcoides fascians]|uniref:hypothetical protein n=1 Tax=Rhodococcoides fascians TaxID=1828 RepID=UPI00050C95AA|nr:hypothetical protein [Rhodococcus fascians]